ncbi:hypothetical protein MAPG_10815 [Magnaporthiopsis poae ATCC 64411]|uniref:Thioredoxin reductase n=1 Tax=Magnaporthiopsis poae (strain ATCC 64411 / 73-15) TaxID=644358 RepID=A0A0C4EDL1_MAGP6|nr:hypothetical protein MAPG_10815 [Magnaporthiopsis poae ATCC 64411]
MVHLSEEFVASIARALNKARVPCVLWGHYLLNVHGVPSIIASIDFVVPDEDLTHGANALTDVTCLAECPNPAGCITSSEARPTPPPAFHKHVQDSDITVGLFPQSETLWFLPPIDSALLSPAGDKLPCQFTLASHQSTLPPWRPGRGAGVFKPGHHPIVVPRSHILLEAFLRLYARNVGKRIGSFGMAMIGYMEGYVDDDGLLDAGLLPEPLRGFYKELHDENMTKPVRQWTRELREALGVVSEEGEDDYT